MAKLIVELSENLHIQLKKKAASNSRTIKEIVTSLIQDYLSRTQKGNLKETGFCGVWEDSRSAEEIVKKIKSARKWFKR